MRVSMCVFPRHKNDKYYKEINQSGFVFKIFLFFCKYTLTPCIS